MSVLCLLWIALRIQLHLVCWNRYFGRVFRDCATLRRNEHDGYRYHAGNRLHVSSRGMGSVVLAAFCAAVWQAIDLHAVSAWVTGYDSLGVSPFYSTLN